MMKKYTTQFRLILVSLISIALIAAGVMALTNPEIPRYFLGAGGEISGGGYSLFGSIGQPEAGRPLKGNGYTLYGGFLAGGGSTDHAIYLPMVLK
jgi:hypothetical protein